MDLKENRGGEETLEPRAVPGQLAPVERREMLALRVRGDFLEK